MIQKAVLDACVLYPASVRDTLLSIAAEGVFTPYWSQLIHNEWQRNLLEDRKDDLTQDILNNTSDVMNSSFPDSFVNDFHHLIEQVELPDEDDRHVLALAIKVKANVIVTNNLKDFPEAKLKQYNVVAISPDEFIMNLYESFDLMIIEAVKRQRARLKNPPKTVEELLETLKTSNLTMFEDCLKKVIEQL